MYDMVISGGRVVDGSGSPAFVGDVAIQDGKIAAVGDMQGVAARRRIDATERVVAPGFIDSHCHSELALIAKPASESKTRQGVTTEILGNCGWSAYPLADATRVAQMALSAVARLEQRFGVGHVTAVLAGASTQPVLRCGHDQLSVHGLLKHLPRTTIANSGI